MAGREMGEVQDVVTNTARTSAYRHRFGYKFAYTSIITEDI